MITGLNEYRKAVFTKINVLIRPALQQLAQHCGLMSWKKLSLLRHEEILELARRSQPMNDLVTTRQTQPLMLIHRTIRTVDLVAGAAVQRFARQFGERVTTTGAVQGTVANGGRIVGTARVIHEPSEFHHLKTGDILIAKMTSVDFIPIMKKAGAFVTDEGGLASHAAVVSREYNKPCIVGTKIATQILKDGDRVEVDATRGIVRKVS